MTPDIAKAWALCEAASIGPWKAYCRDVGNPSNDPSWSREHFLQFDVEGPQVPDGRGDFYGPDAAFIAAARTLLPAALDEIERLRKVEAAARALIEEWKRRCTLNTNIDIDGVPVIPAPPYRQLLDLAIALQSADIPADLPHPVREAF